ncbi:MAG: HAD-IC family P-type ATPase [Bdellovibrionales bacterium]|jgi:cation transport ATPase|nr:HAD-IC family P-type ATPase [Bdellovibrionales bacterium]
MLAQNDHYKKCLHCSELIENNILLVQKEAMFCCNGCKLVYECIQEGGLNNFYEILKTEGNKLSAVSSKANNYDFLKESEFLGEFAQGANKNTFYFYIHGIECMACSWVFSNIGSINNEIENSEFSIEKNLLKLTVRSNDCLHEIISFIASLGYKSIPIKNVREAEKQYEKEKKSDLIRIGISGAIWMNIMIFSVSLYSGVNSDLGNLFKIIQSILFIPVITYSSWPFYKKVYNNLKLFRPSIDLPIVISILLGAILSYRSIFIGIEQFYFDSITMLIFFILSTRFLLSHLFKNEISSSIFESFYGEQQVILIDGDKLKNVHISQVNVNDEILVKGNSIVPLSGDIIDNHSFFNESLITGESRPVQRSIGERVKSGAKNISNDIKIRVVSKKELNCFHDYLSVLEINSSNLEKYTNFGGKYAVSLSVILIVMSGYFIFTLPIFLAYEKILAMMIISCPCALGIGIPLATLLKVKGLAKKGISIRDNSIFEKYENIRTLCFDKTGTITSGRYILDKIEGDNKYLKYLVALEKRSEHPIAKYITKKFILEDEDVDVFDFVEVPGIGVEGTIDGEKFKVNSNLNGNITLKKDATILLTLFLKEEYEQEKIDQIVEFSEKYDVEIISGDREKNVNILKDKMKKSSKIKFFSSLSPIEKRTHLENKKNALYIGDGLNDILAMRESSISISLNVSQLVNDVCSAVFLAGDLKKINLFFKEIEHLHFSIKKIISISILYNIIGLILVMFGFVGPLSAAVLMPLSSLFVVLFTFLQFKGSKQL